jgi:hypothetical protein
MASSAGGGEGEGDDDGVARHTCWAPYIDSPTFSGSAYDDVWVPAGCSAL